MHHHSEQSHIYNPVFFYIIPQLYTIFRSYAKKYPKLGLTPDEFRNLLINECYVSLIIETQQQKQLIL